MGVNNYNSLSKGQSKIKVNNISFTFGKNPILSDVSMDISKNGVYGFVGKSGSGKSTLLNVLMGLYEPNEGSVEYYINNSNTENLIAYVPADNYIFNGTIKENICMDENCDFEKMYKAAQMANADEFINELDNGYSQLIGEKQNSLSSGQGQRIALARAYYRSSAYYVFDEPTSNLDKNSGDIFIDTVRMLGKSSICLVSSHDKKVLENCDRIFYISESGVEDLNSREKIKFYLDNNYIRSIE